MRKFSLSFSNNVTEDIVVATSEFKHVISSCLYEDWCNIHHDIFNDQALYNSGKINDCLDLVSLFCRVTWDLFSDTKLAYRSSSCRNDFFMRLDDLMAEFYNDYEIEKNHMPLERGDDWFTYKIDGTFDVQFILMFYQIFNEPDSTLVSFTEEKKVFKFKNKIIVVLLKDRIMIKSDPFGETSLFPLFLPVSFKSFGIDLEMDIANICFNHNPKFSEFYIDDESDYMRAFFIEKYLDYEKAMNPYYQEISQIVMKKFIF
ncbi:hypothetical protein [Photobacterium leiognathi]|uniref:hypothetical protein n=1 Tax=Photobacterium leiognathi TaxID=553611 RepID=UPI002982AA47|nr:hypothetical protein [Photobacterium leiognathi]